MNDAPESPRTLFGVGVIDRLPALLAERAHRRVMIVCGPSRRFVEDIEVHLGAAERIVYDGALVHVPEAVVEAAAHVAARFQPDVLLAVGGGAAIGLGKALRLQLAAELVAIPTTYSGSEMTSLYGITRQGSKRTGRDPRARPALVLYDAAFVVTLPRAFAVQSAHNALAHPIGALSTGLLDAAAATRALDAALAMIRALDALERSPSDATAALGVLRAASLAGTILDASTLGLHHRLAHLLGGRLGLDHAALHSVLLPASVHLLETQAPAAYEALQRALGDSDVARALKARLRRAGAATSLLALGVDRERVLELAEGDAAKAALLERALAD